MKIKYELVVAKYTTLTDLLYWEVPINYLDGTEQILYDEDLIKHIIKKYGEPNFKKNIIGREEYDILKCDEIIKK